MTLQQIGESLWDWLVLLGPLAIGVLVVVALAGLVAGRRQSGTERQRIWRVALIAVSLLLLMESTGAARWIVASARRAIHLPAELNFNLAVVPASASRVSGASEASIWPAAIWLAGAALVIGRLCWVHARLHRLGNRLPAVTSPAVLDTVRVLSERIGVSMPRVVSCRRLLSPVVIGCREPRLVLPEDFADSFDSDCQAAVLAHELGHIAAGDARWQCLVEFLTSALWWHPAIWWARRQTACAAERAADETTLHIHDGPRLLAQSLVAIGWQLVGRQWHGSLAVAGFRSELAQRVERLLRLDRSAKPHKTSSVGTAGGIAALMFAGVVSVGSSWALAADRSSGLLSRLLAPASLAWDDSSSTNSHAVKSPRTHPESAGIAHLNLTPEQEERFWKLREQIDVATAEMYRLPEGKIARGLEINRIWVSGLKAIFTDDQFADYCRYWEARTPRRMLLRKIS